MKTQKQLKHKTVYMYLVATIVAGLIGIGLAEGFYWMCSNIDLGRMCG